jgi:hypothetical protein
MSVPGALPRRRSSTAGRRSGSSAIRHTMRVIPAETAVRAVVVIDSENQEAGCPFRKRI